MREELIHYTSASGLYGIVESKKLWASHASFVNDNEEVVGFFTRVLPNILNPVLCSPAKDTHRVGAELNDNLRASVDAFKQAHGRGEDHYITSFCATNDLWISQNGLLSQWRGYGLDGGYAIVFDRAEMGKLLDQNPRSTMRKDSH